MGTAPDHIVHGDSARSYHTWASMRGLGKRKRGSLMYLQSRVKSERNMTSATQLAI